MCHLLTFLPEQLVYAGGQVRTVPTDEAGDYVAFGLPPGDVLPWASSEEIATTLVPRTITIAAKAGDGGRLFGSVGPAEIVGAVDAQAGVSIDRRTLDLESPIKDLGEHTVMCELHPEVAFPISVSVIEE